MMVAVEVSGVQLRAGVAGGKFRVERADGSLLVEVPLGADGAGRPVVRPSDADAIVDAIAAAVGAPPGGDRARIRERIREAVEDALAAAGGRVGLPEERPARPARAPRRRDRIPADELGPERGGDGGPPSAEEFLRDLWGYASPEARCFSVSLQAPGSWIPRFFCRDEYGSIDALVRAAAEFVRESRGRGNVYLMVLPLSRRPERGRGGAGDVAAAGWLFADLDYKEPAPAGAPPFEGCREGEGGELECYYREGEEWVHVRRPPLREVVEKVEAAVGAKPTYVVDSGTGYHLYFRLAGEVGVEEFRGHEERLLGALASLGVSADPQARDPARVLRAPGSINPRSGRECRVVYRSDAFLDPKTWKLGGGGAATAPAAPSAVGEEEEGRRPIPPPTRELSEEEVRAIVGALRDCMVRGHRNAVNYRLVAMMIEAGVAKDSAKKVVEALMTEGRSPGTPDEIREELANVDYHYRNDPGEARLEGRPSLVAECAKALVDAGMPLDAAVKRADAAVGAVASVLRSARPREGMALPTPAEPAPASPYLRDALAWWRDNFSLPADAGEWRAASIASYIADALVSAARIRFVRVCTDRRCELYAVDGSRLVDAGVVVEGAVGAPGVRELQSVHLPLLVARDLAATARPVAPEELNPPWALNTRAGVLDLRTLELLPHGGDGPYFTYEAPVSPDPGVLARIREGQYEIEGNQVYRLWRGHFDDENWRYFVSSVGTWLSPRNHRHVAFLVGDRRIGKTSLLSALTAPIEPIVSHADLEEMMGYTFGKESLLGRRVVVQDENAAGVLRDLARLNRLFGERGKIEVYRKGREPLPMAAMRSAMFSMNDLPLIREMRGSTLAAFLDRLSIIQMHAPEGFAPDPGLVDSVTPEEALYFLLWARRELERNGWRIEKLDEEALLQMMFEKSWALAGFWRDCVEEAGEARAADLYSAYLRWAQRHGVAAVGRNAFYDLVAQKAARVLDRDKSLKFVGVRLRDGAGEC